MKTFNAEIFSEDQIVLNTREELIDLYETLTQKEEDFIIVTKIDNKSTIVLANKILGKVKSGEIQLSAMEG